MSAKVAAAAARGTAKGLAKNPNLSPERVSSAVTDAADKAVSATTDAAPSADLAHAADPNVPLGDTLGTLLRGYAYLVAAAYLRRLARTIIGT